MKSSTAIIIGGGVAGLSTAYHLARRGFGKIILLEKDRIGEGSSTRAAGIITGLLWSETGVRARKRSLELFRNLSRELAGYQFHEVGCLNLFDPASWPEREALLPLYQRCGVPFEILDAPAIRHRWPALTPPEDYIGLYDPQGGYSEPHEYVPALSQKLRSLGVDIREGEPVKDFQVRDGRIIGVTTASGNLDADIVVSTVYAWTLPLLARLGMKLPIKTFVHQRYVTHPLPTPIEFPAVNANPLGGYVRPAHGNRLLMGIETADREEYRVASADFHMSAVTADSQIPDCFQSKFARLLPALRAARWEYEKVGLLSFSMDIEPIIGPVGKLPGLYVAVAFHSGGFAYNPIVGELLAEFILDGGTRLDVRAFSPDRFNSAETEKYLATTVQQKDVKGKRH